MIDIPCVIFAGGKSSRMGTDKALLPFAKFDTLAQFQFFRLSKIFSNVYISCKDKTKFNFKAKFIEDEKTICVYAPTIGFISSFNMLNSESIFVISVDTPFISDKEIQKIVNADSKNIDASIAFLDNKLQPMCGIYHKSLLGSFTQMLDKNEHKLNYLLKHSKTISVAFSNKSAFLNINNMQDYKKAKKILSNTLL